jgi:ribosomal protein L11 methyltransferase
VKAFRIRVPSLREDEATALLWEAGTTGIEVTPAGAAEVGLTAYFEDAAAGELRTLLEGLSAGRGSAASEPTAVSVEEVPVPEVDWVARFRESFRGFRAGGFEVVPLWQCAEIGAADPGRLIVDPGRAFGTGTHETTRLCLEAVEAEAARRPLRRVLDVGTGTGLLAVAAAKRGASVVAGVDNDPEATSAARRHAALNRVTLHVVQGDGGAPFRPRSFDLVLANLMAPLLLDRRAEIPGLVAEGGVLVLSGLLDEDVAEVSAGYAACSAPEVRRSGEWAALVFGGRR